MKNARGTLSAQLEPAVAATHWIFKDESETAARYREEAGKLFDAKDYNGARTASKIATASHRLALEARRHLDDLTVHRPPTVTLHVAVMARPDFRGSLYHRCHDPRRALGAGRRGAGRAGARGPGRTSRPATDQLGTIPSLGPGSPSDRAGSSPSR